jgi:hypothetical protein
MANLSPTAWALLGILHRSSNGGPRAPDGFVEEYAELRALHLVEPLLRVITDSGEAALRDYFLAIDAELEHK